MRLFCSGAGAWVFSALAFVLFTNRWANWDEAQKTLFADDVNSYLAIAQAAPALPVSASPLSYHHAQRFFFPWLVGGAAKIFNSNLKIFWRVVAYGLLAGALCFLFFSLRALGLGGDTAGVFLSLLIFSPYGLRYYLLVPGLLPDIAFIFALSGALWALCRHKMIWFFVFCGVTALARQTIWAALPGFCILVGGRGSQKSISFSFLQVGVLIFIVGLIQWTMGTVGKYFSFPSTNAEHILGIFGWIRDQFSARAFLEHALRCGLPLMLAGFIFFGSLYQNRFRVKHVGFFLIAVGIASQPFLAGPEISGKNASRLAALALIPAILATASELKLKNLKIFQKRPLPSLMVLWVLLALGSFHPLYCYFGSSGALPSFTLQVFVLLQIASAILATVVIIK